MNALVPQETIYQMTGVKQPAAQYRRLVREGFRCWRNALGEVCMLLTELQTKREEKQEAARPLRKSQQAKHA